jgi:hypothetical protein
VLSADFADILPPDEDPMPANGNPHPIPGQMQQDNNIFVLPQYPELGCCHHFLRCRMKTSFSQSMRRGVPISLCKSKCSNSKCSKSKWSKLRSMWRRK